MTTETFVMDAELVGGPCDGARVQAGVTLRPDGRYPDAPFLPATIYVTAGPMGAVWSAWPRPCATRYTFDGQRFRA